MAESFNPVEIGEVDANGKLTLAAGNDLDTLRPEVRRADSFLDSMACSADEEAAVKTIRAELLRLAGVEAELAALKARMADACPTDRGGVNNVSSNACSKG